MKISILMSVYNESEDEIKASVNSILKQTYPYFEFIIINDNPNNFEIKSWLKKITSLDSRIIVLNNDENIGLAKSINRAADMATGDYLVRMDADDISDVRRIEKQLEMMQKTNCDLLCTCYSTIDEKGKVIHETSKFLTSDQIKALLPYRNVIHHPTVMIRRTAWEKVGPYRAYPCAQDYDLWLRYLENDLLIMMYPEPLLQYRVRSSSITSKKRFLQAATICYCRKLYRRWKHSHFDRYSEEDYQKYLDSIGVNNTIFSDRFNCANDMINKARMDESKISRIKSFITALLISRFHRKMFFDSILYNIKLVSMRLK